MTTGNTTTFASYLHPKTFNKSDWQTFIIWKVIKRLKTSNVCSLHDVVMLRCLRIRPNFLDLCTVINIFLSNNSSHLSFCRHGVQWTRKCYNFCILKCLNITFNLSLENHSLNNLWTMNTRTLTRQQQSY